VYHHHFWLTIVVSWTRNLVVAASLHCISKCCLVILKTLVDVMPGLNISFGSNVQKALFTLVVINQVLCSTNFVSIKDPIHSSVLNLFFWSCSRPCQLKGFRSRRAIQFWYEVCLHSRPYEEVMNFWHGTISRSGWCHHLHLEIHF
jgi:hypothetical protein